MKRRELLAGFAALPALSLAPAAAFAAERFDVIVIGAGIAGLAAAVAAREAGAPKVAVLEKGPMIGGHAAYADGSLCAVYPPLQRPAGIIDSPEKMASQLWEWGEKRGDMKLIRTLAENSGAAVDWLKDMGVRFMDRVYVSYPGNFPRAITSHPDRGGFEYIWALNRRARLLGVRVFLNSKAISLMMDRGRVSGVEALETSGAIQGYRASSVVIATGGFSANREMMKKYAVIPDSVRGTSANPGGRHFDGADGDGLAMAADAGAALVDMTNVEVIPRKGGRLLDYVGGDIFVNSRGKRFVNENASHGEQAEAVMRQPDQIMWVITDSQSIKGPMLQHKLLIGEVQKANTIEEMAKKMNVSAKNLKDTIERYNRFVDARDDEDFGKDIFTQKISRPPFFFGRDYLEPHYTVGGIRISEKAEVLRGDGSAIPGLWAAGETTGGLHGSNRQGGVAFTECLVFGRIAGTEAAKHAKGAPGGKPSKR